MSVDSYENTNDKSDTCAITQEIKNKQDSFFPSSLGCTYQLQTVVFNPKMNKSIF